MTAVDALPAPMRSKVRDTGDCWDWTGAKNSKGYGSVANGRGGSMLAYELLIGPIPDVLTIDHLCRNKACVNPAHLEPVTIAENTRRAASLITHCRNDHELSGDNLRIKVRARGQQRVCVTCQNAAQRRHRLASSVGTPVEAVPPVPGVSADPIR